MAKKSWEQPGYRFSINWPPGYENGSPYASMTTAEIASSKGVCGGNAHANSQITDAMRRGQLEQLPSGRGSLGVLSPRSSADVAKTERIRRAL